MSQQGPILVVSTAERPSFASRAGRCQAVSGDRDRMGGRGARRRTDAARRRAGRDVRHRRGRTSSAGRADRRAPALSAADRGRSRDRRLPDNAIPFFQAQGNSDRLMARLRAALRVRSLHATVMRRLVPPAPMALSRHRSRPRRDRAADRPRRRLSCALGLARRADRRGRRALDRGRGEASQRPRHRRHRARRRFQPARGRRLPHRAGRGCPLPQPARRGDVGCDLAPAYDLPNLEIDLRRPRARRRDRAAADPPACLRGASEPDAEARSTPRA